MKEEVKEEEEEEEEEDRSFFSTRHDSIRHGLVETNERTSERTNERTIVSSWSYMKLLIASRTVRSSVLLPFHLMQQQQQQQ